MEPGDRLRARAAHGMAVHTLGLSAAAGSCPPVPAAGTSFGARAHLAAGPVGRRTGAVDIALRELSAAAIGGLGDPVAGRRAGGATAGEAELPDLLDRAVAGADLGRRAGRAGGGRRCGPGAARLVVALAGWCGWGRCSPSRGCNCRRPPTPELGGVPLPTVLLLGGVVAGLLLALLSGGRGACRAAASRGRGPGAGAGAGRARRGRGGRRPVEQRARGARVALRGRQAPARLTGGCTPDRRVRAARLTGGCRADGQLTGGCTVDRRLHR